MNNSLELAGVEQNRSIGSLGSVLTGFDLSPSVNRKDSFWGYDLPIMVRR